MDIIFTILLINYSLATILLSFILPKVKVNKLFWYSITLAFLSQFAHTLFVMILLIEIPYHLFLLISSISIVIAGIAIYMDKRIWLGFKICDGKLMNPEGYHSLHEKKVVGIQKKQDKSLKKL